MAQRCPGSCLYGLLVGGGSGGPGAARPGPRAAPKGTACEREGWLEEEVSRLQREAWRLQDCNEELRGEILVKDSDPHSQKGKLSSLLQGVARMNDEEEGGDRERPDRLSRRLTKAEILADEVAALARPESSSTGGLNVVLSTVTGRVNTVILKGSALAMTKPVQAVVYLIALAGVLFVLLATAFHLGALPHPHCGGAGHAGGHDGGHDSGHDGAMDAIDDCDPHAHGRRLGGGVTPLMKNIAVVLTAAGLLALLVNYLKQPLIIAYLLAGVFVGPVGLNIVESHMDISELSSLGLIFLLFMIGLELNIKSLVKLPRVVTITGVLQFPICACIMVLIFGGLEAAGLSFGPGRFASVYCGVTAGLSSTMIVVKLLGAMGETDTQAGRMSVGILLIQDLWALVLLALQTSMGDPTVLGISKTFGMVAVLIVAAMGYAKFVMPAVLFTASKSVELMLVVSLAWCFFVCCTAVLPFVGLPMEIAALSAGMALATFPYSTDFHGKIKYIRDFFFTLFFAGMGMMLPFPSFRDVLGGLLISFVVVVVRWLGIGGPVMAMGGGSRLAAIAALNLSQISEFSLVITSLGVVRGHISSETLEIMIMTFLILAVSSSYLVNYNTIIYLHVALPFYNKLLGRPAVKAQLDQDPFDDERDIVLLGFNKVAFMLVTEFKAKTPELLRKLHVIDFNKTIMPKLRELGIKCTYGDIGSANVLEKAHVGEPRIAISTIPDSLLQGVSNSKLVNIVHMVWPSANVIVTADSPQQAKQLYHDGADYVLRMEKLSAERLHDVLQDHVLNALQQNSVKELFDHYKARDKDAATTNFSNLKF